jgi:hypothetical protein
LHEVFADGGPGKELPVVKALAVAEEEIEIGDGQTFGVSVDVLCVFFVDVVDGVLDDRSL